MANIPASQIVQAVPGVLGGGGTALDLNGLLLTTSSRVPIGTAQSFPTPDAVGAYFGPTSLEAIFADSYFLGFDNSHLKPGALLVAQYNTAAVGAYLRGANVSSLTLSQLQAIVGTLVVTIDGAPITSSSINLSSATSFSNAATLINTGLGVTGPVGAAITASITGAVMTVTAHGANPVVPGQILSGTGITAGTVVVNQLTGVVGVNGTYTVSVSQTVASGSMTTRYPAVQYDPIAGAFAIFSGTAGAASTIGYASGTGNIATGLGLTQSTGAVLSQGANGTDPISAMTAISAQTKNWAVLVTLFEPVASDKVLFAQWINSTGGEFAYAMWDTDASPTATVPATSSAKYLIDQAGFGGTIATYAPNNLSSIGAFVAGTIASIDFTQKDGRITLAFRSQEGLVPDVTDATIAANLLANGYNFYGDYATSNDEFIWFYDGSISGKFLWADSYVNQIWLNNELQLAYMELLKTAYSIPYNSDGYALISSAALDPIQQAIIFGAIRKGVALSNAQKAALQAAAGLDISGAITSQGYYLQVLDPGSQVRVARGSPSCALWYADGQSVQKINFGSVEVQ